MIDRLKEQQGQPSGESGPGAGAPIPFKGAGQPNVDPPAKLTTRNDPERPQPPIVPDSRADQRRNADLTRAFLARVEVRDGRVCANICAQWGALVPVSAGPMLLIPGPAGKPVPQYKVDRPELDAAGRSGRRSILAKMMADLRVTALREWLHEHAASASVAQVYAALVAIEKGEEPELPK